MKEKNQINSPCDDCQDVEGFSFTGCAAQCKVFFEHLKIVFAKEGSPCKDFRCGVPGAGKKNKIKCERRGGCPFPDIYSKSLGDGLKCPLGVKKDVTRYVHPYDGKYNWEGRCR